MSASLWHRRPLTLKERALEIEAGLAFWGGLILGDGGMIFTLVRARHEAEKRGL